MAIWNKPKPPFNLFTDYRILYCYCIAVGAYTVNKRLHLFFKPFGKLVITSSGAGRQAIIASAHFSAACRNTLSLNISSGIITSLLGVRIILFSILRISDPV